MSQSIVVKMTNPELNREELKDILKKFFKHKKIETYEFFNVTGPLELQLFFDGQIDAQVLFEIGMEIGRLEGMKRIFNEIYDIKGKLLK